MFLFNKRTRNIIKIFWAFFAVIIMLTMVIAYSGFATLARTQPNSQQQIEIPDEVRQQLLDQQNGTTPADDNATATKEQAVRKAIEEGKIDLNAIPAEGAPQTPPQQELKLEI